MIPERVDFWGIPQPWGPVLVYAVLFLAVGWFFVRLYLDSIRLWKAGRSIKRWDHLLLRLRNLIIQGFLQLRTLRQRYGGILHICLSWPFLVFFLGTVLATLNSHIYTFLVGNIYLVYKLILDLAIVPFLLGAGMALYRRLWLRPSRLTLTIPFVVSLFLLVGIVLSGLVVESLRLAVVQPEWAVWSPIGWLLARLWLAGGVSDEVLRSWHLALYSLHVVIVVAFFTVMPTGRLVHIISAPLSIFFSSLAPSGASLSPVTKDESGRVVYVQNKEDLTWKQCIEGDACTECGRCQEVCPAFASGLPLSPKQIIVSLRDRKGNQPSKRITSEELWACTTCGACEAECPVLIEHVQLLVDYRRAEVHNGQLDAGLQKTLYNWQHYGNAAGLAKRKRNEWARSGPIKIKDARSDRVDYVWFLGDTLSCDPQFGEIARKTADVFRAAGLNFGILFEAEQNSGNDARRIGEEGLFEELMRRNCTILEQCHGQTIITTDPHTYNTLKNEYPLAAVAGRSVLHSIEMIDHLIKTGALIISKKLNYRVTYHDPCYLGRLNGIFDPPRRILEALGCQLIEMPRNRMEAPCCGAGGGRIWMDEGPVKCRPSEMRLREAMELGKDTCFVTACPKDLIMFQDASSSMSDQSLAIRDLIDLVYEAICVGGELV